MICTATYPRLENPLSAEQMIENLHMAMAEIPPEPIGEWMRTQGKPPEEWFVVLPEELRKSASDWALPVYVKFSLAVAAPIFVPRPMPGWMVRPEDW